MEPITVGCYSFFLPAFLRLSNAGTKISFNSLPTHNREIGPWWVLGQFFLIGAGVEEGGLNLGNGEGQVKKGQGQGLPALVRSHFGSDFQRALLKNQQN